jgi:two-component system sensor histidine kinase GlrK
VRYPRSFLKLLLAGFTLVALPLVVALITSSIAVDRLANRSQTAVYKAVQATQSSRRLSELLTAMERSARQIVILNDRSLLEAYKISRAQFEETATQLADLTFDEEQLAELAAIVQTEQQIFSALSNSALRPAALQAPVSRYVELSNRAQAIMAKSGQLIDREVEAMREAAIDIQRIMLWQGLSLFPVIIFLVVGFALLIARPIRQIDAAIRDLGDGKFNVPIAVNGPEDLEFLGERL